MIGELVAAVGGQGPSAAVLGAVGEQLADVGLSDSDPTAGVLGDPASLGEGGVVAGAVRFLANPALRAVSLAVAGPRAAGTAFELLAAAVFLAVVVAAHRGLPVRNHPPATVALPPVHPGTGVLNMTDTTPEGGTQMTGQTLESVRAEALFVSHAQRSDRLSAGEVRALVLDTVRRYGTRHLAAIVAAEYGEHPDTAVTRMSWALGAVREAYPAAREAYPAAA